MKSKILAATLEKNTLLKFAVLSSNLLDHSPLKIYYLPLTKVSIFCDDSSYSLRPVKGPPNAEKMALLPSYPHNLSQF